MRKVNKNKIPPIVKFTSVRHPNLGKQKWRVHTLQLCRDFDTDPKPFSKGEVKFNDDFGYQEFRNDLISTIGNKCCYCERPIDNGEIEHFRPKAGYKNDTSGSLERPGYYWLAYNWDNMLISCGECNDQKRKGNKFPLIDESTRVTDRSMSIDQENPFYINPAKEDPTLYLSFNLHKIVPVGSSGRGEKVIEDFELDKRADLISPREEKLKLFRMSYKITQYDTSKGDFYDQNAIDEAKDIIDRCQSPKEPFSGMIIENLKNSLI